MVTVFKVLHFISSMLYKNSSYMYVHNDIHTLTQLEFVKEILWLKTAIVYIFRSFNFSFVDLLFQLLYGYKVLL